MEFPIDISKASGLSSDSREIKSGWIFVAVRGEKADGHRFINQAAAAGAILVIGEEAKPNALPCPYLQVQNSRIALAEAAAVFYQNPTKDMKVIGITGTSGKTTTSYLVEAILTEAGFTVGVIGTINTRYKDKIVSATHTTPGPVELQKLLSEMKAAGCNAVVMEVSSHSLKQYRIKGVLFDSVVFTNLSPEHMDFHIDMEDYYNSKKLLFTEHIVDAIKGGKKPITAINGDDFYGQRLFAELQNAKQVGRLISYGIDKHRDISGSELKVQISGIKGVVGRVPISSSLIADFNAMNILGAVAAVQGLAINPEIIGKGIAKTTVVPGRLEKVLNDKGINVIVDYAHKPDALEKVLHTLSAIKAAGRIFTVFGCGGDRDKSKRPVMGRLAVEGSEHVFITSDNPRTENPEAIISEIITGVATQRNYTVIPDREAAIRAALKVAKVGDIVLIAGKGHETYQIVADPDHPGMTKKLLFDDSEIVKRILK